MAAEARELTAEDRAEIDELMREIAEGRQNREPRAVCDNGTARLLKNFKPVKAITAAELAALDIPPITWLVKGLLPVGLSMIGAPSKYFKSYMALDLCVSICNGAPFMGFETYKHACLYLDLESTKRRPRDRLKQIVGARGHIPENLYILTGEDDVGRIGEGFEAQMEYQLQEHPEIKLIVVDVFQMIRQPAKRNQTGYDRDYDDFKALKKFADFHGIGILLIHHTRKMKDPSDVFNELSGSVGVMGALDSAWVIQKDDRFADEATLNITGRDLESQQLKITFNKNRMRWECAGTVEDVELNRLKEKYRSSPVIQTIKKLVAQNGGREWTGTVTEIIHASRYLGEEIHMTTQKAGKEIDTFTKWLLEWDSIEISKDRQHGGRKITFTNINPFTNNK